MSDEPVRLEFLVEPFVEGRPGRHVTAAIEAATGHGLDVELGAFGSVVRGRAGDIAAAVSGLLGAALDAGATRVTLQAVTESAEASIHVGSLHNALDQLIQHVELELGSDLAVLDRQARQAAIRMLDERGAFLLRKAIEDVADAMGVSRITIYNYLNAIRG